MEILLQLQEKINKFNSLPIHVKKENTSTLKMLKQQYNSIKKYGTVYRGGVWHTCKCLDGLKALKTGKIYSYYWTRSQGRCSLVNRYGQIENFLRVLKIDFVTGNDKNGGKESDFIQLTAKGKRQIKDIDFNLL